LPRPRRLQYSRELARLRPFRAPLAARYACDGRAAVAGCRVLPAPELAERRSSLSKTEPRTNEGAVAAVVPDRDAENEQIDATPSTGDAPANDGSEADAVRTRTTSGPRLSEDQLGPLVERARTGDLAAFEDIVRLMQGPIRSFSRRMMRDPYLGDDAAQETFFRMWKGIGRHQPRGRFISWSFTVARNTCIEFLRREGRTPRPVAEIVGELHDPMADVDVGRVVNEAIAELDEPYRSTFLLRETGLAYDEVADALDCPVGTVRSRLHEARRRLAEKLRPEFGFVAGWGEATRTEGGGVA